jgi:hypothetical protein
MVVVFYRVEPVVQRVALVGAPPPPQAPDAVSTATVEGEDRGEMSDTTTTRGRTTRPDHVHIEHSIADIAKVLQEHLGQRLTAHMARLADPKAIGQIAAGKRTPRDAPEKRLRAAYNVLTLLLDEESAFSARAWFIGMNPQLDDEAPADVIREGRLRDVVAAARSYSTGG